MGLDDRDYMRKVPIYEALVGRGSDLPGLNTLTSAHRQAPAVLRPTPGRTRPWAWFLLGAIAMLAVVAYLARPHQSAPAPTPVPIMPVPAAPSFQVVPAPT